MTHEHHHSDTEHGAHGMSHGSAAQYLRRFWIVTFLLVPLVLVHPKVAAVLGISFALSGWVQLGIATVIFGFSLVFFRHAWHEIQARAYGMMTLVSLAVASGYLFSVASTFIPALDAAFYLEIATLIWVLLFGHYLEAKSGSAAGDALSEVAKLLPKQAHKLEGHDEVDVDVDSLRVGDTVVVKPGEKIPADGTILAGSADVDESHISGESKPVAKREGMEVVAGAICRDGSLTISLTRVGEHSTIGQIRSLIARAGETKPRAQRIADTAAMLLTLVAGSAALLTLVVWTFIIDAPLAFSLTLAITVLVIACPHALGLAIPTVTTIATSLAVKNGFFIKDLAKIETIRRSDVVVFDKTGTLTKGAFGVSGIVAFGSDDEERILSIAASLEQHASHIIGHALIRYARTEGTVLQNITDFHNIAGQGVTGRIAGETYYAGNEALMRTVDPGFAGADGAIGTLVYVADAERVLGYITLADSVKDSAKRAVSELHAMGIRVAMLTGDNEQVARSVAQELSIDTYVADVRPEDKYTHIRALQEAGDVVLMVGDGVNDAPALTQADVGAAIGAGTDIAVEAGDVVLTESDPYDIVRLITLSKRVYTKMIQNLIWALGYNVVAIPAAAGVFATWGFFLRPEIGALVMSLSTVIVVVNALSLRRLRL